MAVEVQLSQYCIVHFARQKFMMYHKVAAVLWAFCYHTIGISMFLHLATSHTMIFEVHGLYIYCIADFKMAL